MDKLIKTPGTLEENMLKEILEKVNEILALLKKEHTEE